MTVKSTIRIILLGAHHPHFYIRVGVLQQRNDVDIIGFWEEDQKLAEKVQKRTGIQRFTSEHDLLKKTFDVAFVHTLDHDNPRLARLSAAAGARGVLLEKPGATHPKHIFELAGDLEKYPNLVVEYGWEMHYARIMDVVRDLVRKQALGQITTSHWHGGTPSGGGMELWQRQPGTLGGIVYMDCTHTLEAIVDVFGLPNRVCASIRKLPKSCEKHPIVSCWYDMDKDELDPATTQFGVGELMYEDIGSCILEYNTHNVVADFTAWEPTDWCQDWGINLYGTNGTFHGVLNPAVGQIMLRTEKAGYKQGKTEIVPELGKGVSNQIGYYTRQIDLLLKRVRTGEQTESAGLPIQINLMKVLEAMYSSAEHGKFVSLQ